MAAVSRHNNTILRIVLSGGFRRTSAALFSGGPSHWNLQSLLDRYAILIGLKVTSEEVCGAGDLWPVLPLATPPLLRSGPQIAYLSAQGSGQVSPPQTSCGRSKRPQLDAEHHRTGGDATNRIKLGRFSATTRRSRLCRRDRPQLAECYRLVFY